MRQVKLKSVKNIHGVHFHPDGQKLMVVGGDEVQYPNQVIWIDVVEGIEERRFEINCDCYAVTPDLAKMALGAPRNDEGDPLCQLGLINPAEDKIKLIPVNLELEEGYFEFFGVGMSRDGKRLVASFRAGRYTENTLDQLVIKSLAKGGKALHLSPEESTLAGTMSFSPDGKFLALSGGREGPCSVVISHTKNWKYSHEYNPKNIPTRQVLYSPDGQTLAVANGRNVSLLSPMAEVPTHLLKDHPKQVNAVAFSPDSTRIMSACQDGLIRVWEVESGTLLQKFDWGLGAMTAIDYAPDGTTAAAGGSRGQVVIWDVDH